MLVQIRSITCISPSKHLRLERPWTRAIVVSPLPLHNRSHSPPSRPHPSPDPQPFWLKVGEPLRNPRPFTPYFVPAAIAMLGQTPGMIVKNTFLDYCEPSDDERLSAGGRPSSTPPALGRDSGRGRFFDIGFAAPQLPRLDALLGATTPGPGESAAGEIRALPTTPRREPPARTNGASPRPGPGSRRALGGGGMEHLRFRTEKSNTSPRAPRGLDASAGNLAIPSHFETSTSSRPRTIHWERPKRMLTSGGIVAGRKFDFGFKDTKARGAAGVP